MDNMTEEVWKDIKGFEGLYRISSLGRVVSLNYQGTGRLKELTHCISSTGYPKVTLCFEKKYHQKSIHRLLALHFIPNPQNLPIVLHKDDDPSNYSLDNLEWGTQAKNMQDAFLRDRKHVHPLQREFIKKAQEACKRPSWWVHPIHGKEYLAIIDLINKYSDDRLISQNLTKVRNGERKHHKQWRFIQ